MEGMLPLLLRDFAKMTFPSWVAIMLGRLYMATSQVIKTYLDVCSVIHNTYRHDAPLGAWQRETKATVFEAMLKVIVTNNVKDGQENLRIQNPTCYVCVFLLLRNESGYLIFEATQNAIK